MARRYRYEYLIRKRAKERAKALKLQETESNKENAKPNVKKELLGWLLYFVVILSATYLIVNFVGQRTRVSGDSMLETLHDGDNLIVDKISYRFREPKRFEIIVFPYQHQKDTFYIKRIIGMPGEELDIIDEKVYINGVMLDETYTMDGTTYGNIQDLIIPEGEYFCMGDNRDVSIDSRDPGVGCVDEAQLVGRVFFRLFPFSGFGAVKNPYNQ